MILILEEKSLFSFEKKKLMRKLKFAILKKKNMILHAIFVVKIDFIILTENENFIK